MSVISVFNQKGGSGKTMLCVHLAVAAHLKGLRTLILDLDEQGSATNWYRARGAIPGPVVALQPVNDDSPLLRNAAGR